MCVAAPYAFAASTDVSSTGSNGVLVLYGLHGRAQWNIACLIVAVVTMLVLQSGWGGLRLVEVVPYRELGRALENGRIERVESGGAGAGRQVVALQSAVFTRV